MKLKLFFKFFLSSLFVAALTSVYLFAWLSNVEAGISFSGLTSAYIIALIAICFVASWWLERGFFKVLFEYDNSLHLLTHDLRNPLQAIRGFLLYLIKEMPGPLNKEQKKMLLSMNRASLRLMWMIYNILDIAKVEAGQMKIEPHELSLKSLAGSVASIMEGIGVTKHIKLSISGTSGRVNGDPVLLERAITNLISNAIKFCGEKGKIIIKIKEDEKKAAISISDNGEGIPKSRLREIFEKYNQFGRRKSGTGLGLSLCKYVALLHKGKIMVKSELGKGTCFTLILPKNAAWQIKKK